MHYYHYDLHSSIARATDSDESERLVGTSLAPDIVDLTREVDKP